MGTSVSRTPVSTEETAPTREGRSTAPVLPPTMEKRVSWELENIQLNHNPADQARGSVGSTQKMAKIPLIFDTSPFVPAASLSEYPQCPTDGPTACQQFCTTLYHTFRCFCMPGFKLQSDKRSCLPEGLIHQYSPTDPVCSD